MGQFMHQRAASCTACAGHGIIQQLATQVDAAGESATMHIGRQVVAPAHLHVCWQCAQQAIWQQGLHVGQGLHRHLLLCRAQPFRIQAQVSAGMCGRNGQQ